MTNNLHVPGSLAGAELDGHSPLLQQALRFNGGNRQLRRQLLHSMRSAPVAEVHKKYHGELPGGRGT